MTDRIEALREALSELQQQTILIDCKGSVLGPEEDARAFKASLDTAEAAIRQLIDEECADRQWTLLERIEASVRQHTVPEGPRLVTRSYVLNTLEFERSKLRGVPQPPEQGQITKQIQEGKRSS